MEITATLFIGKDSTLLVVFEKKYRKYTLQYVKKLSNVLDITALSSDSSVAAITEMTNILSDFSVDNFFVTLNSDHYITTPIPGSFQKNSKEILKLIDLSIKQYHPNKSIDDFRVKSIPVNSANPMEFVSIISKDIIVSVESIVAMFGCELTDINPSHISAINSFSFNYPEKNTETTILVQSTNDVLEFIIISNNTVLGFEYCISEKDVLISKTFENKLRQIISHYNLSNINNIYFYGNKLNKQEYADCWKVGMIVSNDCKRFNPFKLFNSDLEQRDKDYCIRTFQMYVLCMGGALPIQIPIAIY